MSESNSIQLEQFALRERIKELNCLYGIAQIAAIPNLNTVLQGIASLLPSAWLYPEIAIGCIRFDNYAYSTAECKNAVNKIASDIIINGSKHGTVEVIYTQEKPNLDEVPFLKE
ncbi:MAG: hypothetical protein V1701_03355 [Planctomycetota bacterium]